jgi:hypothetical protein
MEIKTREKRNILRNRYKKNIEEKEITEGFRRKERSKFVYGVSSLSLGKILDSKD